MVAAIPTFPAPGKGKRGEKGGKDSTAQRAPPVEGAAKNPFPAPDHSWFLLMKRKGRGRGGKKKTQKAVAEAVRVSVSISPRKKKGGGGRGLSGFPLGLL